MKLSKKCGMIRIGTRSTGSQWGLLLVFYLLLWQSPLEGVHSVFKYIDEAAGLIGVAVYTYRTLVTGKLRMKLGTAGVILCLIVFLISGVVGNMLFQYQPTRYVLIDLYTNIKFYLCIVTGYVLFRNCREETKQLIASHSRAMAVIFFVMLLLDQTLHVFYSPEIRYGLRVSALTHRHATYLAGSMVFLITVMTAFYNKKNWPYIGMSLIVLFFTLRSKAIAGAAVYVLLVYFILVYRKKLKLWHLVVMGIAVIWLAWDNYSYYYIELEGQSARSVLTQTSFEILKDYFPIGTGFGTYGSAVAGEHYSPVYVRYGFLQVYELGGNDSGWGFFSDTFWPIIIGQTGFIGVACYIMVVAMLFLRILRIRKYDMYAYIASLFVFAYIMISSTSEPAFNNSVTIPLAVMLGYSFSLSLPMDKINMRI